MGLEHSFFDTEVSRHGEMAQRYDRDGKVFPFYVTSTPGTGELYASAHDVARFAMFHLKDHLADQQQILSDAQIDELHRPVIRVREDRSHGVGWMLGRAFDGTPVVYHTGNQAGVVNVMMLLPSRDIACVVLTNHDDSHDLVDRIRDAAFERWSRPGRGSLWLPRLRSRCRKRIAARGAARCAMVRASSLSFCPLPMGNRVSRSAARSPSRSRS